MKRTVKVQNLIAFTAVLILLFSVSAITAYAQDPFTAVTVGLGGASGAGLFGAVGSAMGIDTAQTNQDSLDSWWYESGEPAITINGVRHKGTGQPDDPYDYIIVDSTSWANIRNYVNANTTYYELTDNDSEVFQTHKSYKGYPFTTSTNTGYTVGPSLGTIYLNQSYIVGSASANTNQTTNDQFYFASAYQGSPIEGTWCNKTWIPYNTLYLGNWNNTTYWVRFNGTQYELLVRSGIPGSELTQPTNVSVTTGEIDPFWGDDFLNGAKISIASTPDLTPQFTAEDFLQTLSEYVAANGSIGSGITVEDADPQPVPPQPIPDTPLGDVPFDDWVDLWGQSIWDQLTRLEEKQELMVINQETGLDSLDDLQGLGEDLIEDVNDLIGLETDINENLEDVITYEQGISEDVEDISENVEDIEDEVIVIVDEMGNVIDVLEGIDAKIYAQGQTIGSISTEVGTVADVAEAIQTEVEAQTETQEDIKDAVEDMIPYVAPLPDIATDTETMVDILPDIATATQTSTQTLTDTLPDIKDATETITETLPDIITEIQDATTTLTDDIPNIDDICENIDEAPYKDIDTGLDHLPRFMLPFITDLRSALGIWHYVTEWLAQISTTFAFITGCLVGTSIMTPIYAAIAGFMCIKIYRRMTS